MVSFVKEGDVVNLRSDRSHKMTIEAFYGGDRVKCIWFAKDNTINSRMFHFDLLEKYIEEPKQQVKPINEVVNLGNINTKGQRLIPEPWRD